MEMRIMPEGDRALVVDFGEYIDEAVNDAVNALARKIRKHQFEGVEEMIPTFRSLLILFDPKRTSMRALRILADWMKGLPHRVSRRRGFLSLPARWLSVAIRQVYIRLRLPEGGEL